MTVHLVHLKTTGEVWHTAVCENQRAAETVMRNYAITQLVHGNSSRPFEFQLWTSVIDPTQTASVICREVVKDRG